MGVIFYASVCAVFLGISYIIDQQQENKRLRAQLHAARQEPEIERQFVNISA